MNKEDGTVEATLVSLPALQHLRDCPPDQAVSAWDEPGLPTSAGEHMTVVSIMSGDAWNVLHAGNRLQQFWANVPNEFAGAYGWMTGQMAARQIGDGMSPPLWAWAQICRDDLVDLSVAAPAGSVFVIASVPASRVLLSSFEDWHAVLNRMWCPPPGTVTLPGWEGSFPDEDPMQTSQVAVEASWKWCLAAAGLCSAGDRVQAALPWLWGHEVVTAVRLDPVPHGMGALFGG